MTAAIEITGHDLTIDDIVAVARRKAEIVVAPAARERSAAARRIVDAALARGDAVYGLTTGLGANVGTRLPEDDLADFQRRVLRGRSVAVGAPYRTEIVRAALLLRANGFATGGSGISPHLLDAVAMMLNRRLHPVVPSTGSIGCADLAPMAHLMLPLIGEGLAEFEGEVLPGGEALRRAGMAPAALAPKDGLGLINSNALTIGQAALALADAGETAEFMALAASLALEGFRANLGPLAPATIRVRAAPGQSEAAALLRGFLRDSSLAVPDPARVVQDPLSFRCVAAVLGAVIAAVTHARAALEPELNAASDNPLVLAETGELVSTGNFHIGALAVAFDGLRLALAQAATAASWRTMKLMVPEASGLPKFLTRLGGGRTGFATVQKTIAALLAEIRHAANPASLDFVTVANGVEDHASLAPLAVRKTEEMLRLLRLLVAIELLTAAQAIDLAPPRKLGRGTAAAHGAIRRVVKPLEDDRPLGPEIETLAEQLAEILRAARRA